MSRRFLIRMVALAILATACAADSSQVSTTTTGPSSTSTTATTTTLAPTTSTTAASTTSSNLPAYQSPVDLVIEAFPVPAGSRPHDVAPAADGGVWYTAQGSGDLGWLDPATGETIHIPLGSGSRPHGVIVDDEGTPWITDGGLNAIVSVDPETQEVTVYPLPVDRAGANLNTATIDGSGLLWFTGQGGVYGSLDPGNGEMAVYDAPDGRGPYGITATPAGSCSMPLWQVHTSPPLARTARRPSSSHPLPTREHDASGQIRRVESG